MKARARGWWFAGAGAVLMAVVAALIVSYSLSSKGVPAASPETVSPSAPSPIPSTTPAPTPSAGPVPTPSPSTAPAVASKAEAVLAAMSLEQRVGQVLMVSSPVTGADAASLHALDDLLVGNIFMKGRSTAGVTGIAAQVAAVAAHVSGAQTQGALPFIATDQEGGLVQIMRGPGFSDMPQAIEQGEEAPAQLQADATVWGKQLASVGVNVNLAPVMDTVPSAAFAPQNAPIGAFGREYGYAPAAVSSHGVAFAKGMLAAGVDPTIKHFPGLGRVTANTDVSTGVTDNAMVRNDAYLGPFRDAVTAGVPWLMVSNALYPQIDPTNLAPFSRVVVHDMVRGDLGFTGIIVSDDICDAVQVSAVPVSQRGVYFLQAGGTMALCTNQSLVPAMQAGIVAQAQIDPAFSAQVDAAALLVLEAKADKGLLR